MRYAVIINEKGQCWDTIAKDWSNFPKTMNDDVDVWETELSFASESADKNNLLIDVIFWEEGQDLAKMIKEILVENGWNN